MIGERPLELRKDAGLTQDELGAAIHVSMHSISSYERDKSEPPDEIKIHIAKFFGVSLDYLLGMTDDPNPNWAADNLIRLPRNFPARALKELHGYIEFLMHRYGR